MGLSVRERADLVATYRYVSVFLMETLARWVPTTPPLEAKALFGRHLWELAQHADQFGRRTAELRTALHQSRKPVDDYQSALNDLADRTDTGDRLRGFYDAMLPDLERRYRAYLDDSDPLMDEPTVRVLERALKDFTRMGKDRDHLIAERPDLAAGDAEWAAELARRVAACGDFVDYRPAPAAQEAG